MIVSFSAFSVLMLFVLKCVHAPPRFILIVTKNIFFLQCKNICQKTVAYYHYLCSTTQGARSAHGSSRQLSTLGPSSAWSCLPTSRKCEQDKIGSTVLGNRGLLNSNFLDGLNHQFGPVTSVPWRPGRSASTLSPWKLTSPSTGDFHWSPAPGRCPYSHHTCHGCPCEVRSISASGYGCNVFQKIHKYATNNANVSRRRSKSREVLKS